MVHNYVYTYWYYDVRMHVCALDRAFTNVLRPVVRMRTTQVPHRQASTPGAPTSTSRDVSDKAFPELSNFLRVTLRACGGRPGNEASVLWHFHIPLNFTSTNIKVKNMLKTNDITKQIKIIL